MRSTLIWKNFFLIKKIINLYFDYFFLNIYFHTFFLIYLDSYLDNPKLLKVKNLLIKS